MLLRVAVQDGNRKEWSELTRWSLAIASRLAVSHELAVRCHLRLESSKGSARLHIQDGSWQLAAQLGLSTRVALEGLYLYLGLLTACS